MPEYLVVPRYWIDPAGVTFWTYDIVYTMDGKTSKCFIVDSAKRASMLEAQYAGAAELNRILIKKKRACLG